ncbi:MAG TPA: hypothetical protein VE988_29760, partial [Gemmataceae bacterium]|nr:hypothetical protein [Gemmataceae bacterium]
MYRLHPALALLLVYLFIPTASATELQRLAVSDGRCEFVLPTEHADDQYLLILGALAQTGGPYPVHIATEQTTAALSIPLEAPKIDLAWQKHVKDLAERQAAARRQRPANAMFAPLQTPPREKVFHLFVKDADFQNPASYVPVTAELRGVGNHCQVYVDRDHADVAGLQPTIDDAIRTFDNNVWPSALGSVFDVDRDGRFT